jgi:hypothetical protein
MKFSLDTDWRIVFFDPGGTTGCAMFDRCKGDTQWHLIEVTQFSLWNRVEPYVTMADGVIFESIHVNHAHFNPIGLEVIGVIKYLCQLWDIPFISRSPGNLTGPMTWPILEEFRKLSAKTPHGRDAMMHGVAFLGPENVALNDTDWALEKSSVDRL